jgi:HK97 family phage major capsid protein
MSIIERPTSSELRESLTDLALEVREMSATPADDRTENFNADLRTKTLQLHAADAEFDAARAAEAHEMQQMAWDHAVANPAPASRGPEAAFGDSGRREPRSLGARYVASPEYQEWAERAKSATGGERSNLPTIEVRALIDSDTTSGVDGNAGMLLPQGQPMLPTPRQMKLTVRDLIPSTTTTLASVPYVRENTPATDETGASSVAEGVAKPEVIMEWTDEDAPVRKIAAWVPATTEILADAPTLRGYIDGRLRYMVALREQDEILRGNGVAPDLTGILNTTGIQTQTAVNNDVPATVASAISKVELVDGDANGIVMSPTDYWTSVATRRSTFFDGAANAQMGAPFAEPLDTLWGRPVVRTRAFASLSSLVGDFTGAMIFDRQGVTIRQSDSHDTYFILNKVAILAEERLALAVFRPDYFVSTTLDITA